MSVTSLITGTAFTPTRARRALPYLVRLAEAKQTLTYAQLAAATDVPNVRSLSGIVGEVGSAIEELGTIQYVPIPPIQSIDVSKTTGLPGNGISRFADVDYAELSKKERLDWLTGALG